MPDIHFSIQVACEATQPTIRDAALGERAIRGLAGIFERSGIKATFVAIPSELRAHAALYREMREQGHEVGLHIHLKMIDAARRICEKAGCAFKAATTGEIARDYRRRVPKPTAGVKLALDTRGR